MRRRISFTFDKVNPNNVIQHNKKCKTNANILHKDTERNNSKSRWPRKKIKRKYEKILFFQNVSGEDVEMRGQVYREIKHVIS